MVLGAVASFARPGHMALDVPLIALVLVMVGLPCIALGRIGIGAEAVSARAPCAARFNIGMALLLVLSILPGCGRRSARRSDRASGKNDDARPGERASASVAVVRPSPSGRAMARVQVLQHHAANPSRTASSADHATQSS